MHISPLLHHVRMLPQASDCYANVRIKHIVEEAFGPAGDECTISHALRQSTISRSYLPLLHHILVLHRPRTATPMHHLSYSSLLCTSSHTMHHLSHLYLSSSPQASDCYANVRIKHIVEEAFGPAGEVMALVREGEKIADNSEEGEKGALGKYREAWTLCSVYGGEPTAIPVEDAEEVERHYESDLSKMVAGAARAGGSSSGEKSAMGQDPHTAAAVSSVSSVGDGRNFARRASEDVGETEGDVAVGGFSSLEASRENSMMMETQGGGAGAVPREDSIGDDVRSYVCLRCVDPPPPCKPMISCGASARMGRMVLLGVNSNASRLFWRGPLLVRLSLMRVSGVRLGHASPWAGVRVLI